MPSWDVTLPVLSSTHLPCSICSALTLVAEDIWFLYTETETTSLKASPPPPLPPASFLYWSNHLELHTLLILSSSAFPLGGEGALFLFFKCRPSLQSTFQQCLNFSIHWLSTVGSVAPLLRCPDSPLVQWGSLHNVGSSFRVWGQPGCGCLSSGSNCCCSPTAAD